MGFFHDLPKDVIWLIFRNVLQDFFLEINETFAIFQPRSCFYKFLNRYWTESKKQTRKLLSVYATSDLECQGIVFQKMCDLALISKDCFELIRTKTHISIPNYVYRVKLWKFIKGAF